MKGEVLLGLLNNAALLLALALLYDAIGPRRGKTSIRMGLISGILIGIIGIAVMATPWQPVEGVNIDARSVLLSMAAMFCGFVPAVVSVIMTLLFRLYLGGDGMIAGFLLITGSAAIGLIWRRVRGFDCENRSPDWLELYLVGMLVHFWMIICLMVIPSGKNVISIHQVGLPLMLIYPVGTVLLGMLLVRQCQRLKSQEDLAHERKLLTQVVETSPVGIVMADSHGTFNFANSYARRILGLSAEEDISNLSINSPKWNLADAQGNDLNDGMQLFNLVRDGMVPVFDVQHNMSWEDGRRVQLSVNSAPILDSRGAFVGIVSAMEDITRRRRSEARIRKLNRVLTVLTNINQAIIRVRQPNEMLEDACRIAVHDGGLRAACVFLRNTDSESFSVVARSSQENDFHSIFQEIMNDDSADSKRVMATLEKGDRVVVEDAPNDSRLGGYAVRSFEMGILCYAAFPLMVAGKLAGIMCLYSGQEGFFDSDEIQLLDELAMDLSFALEFAEHEEGRRKAEAKLRDSEQRYRSIFTDSQAAMMLLDPSDGAILDANGAACEYYGWTLDELQARKITDINTLSSEQIAEEMRRATEQCRAPFFFKHRLANGDIRDVEVYCGPIRLGDRLLLFSIIHDISERVRVAAERDQIEAQLRQSQKMEAVGRLAGGVAHDVNNMLTVILGYSEYSLADVDADDESFQWVREIRAAAKRSAGLIEQLLAFSRKQIVQPQVLDLNQEVDRQIAMLSRLVGEDMEMEFIPGHDVWNVMMDPSQIDQILANLAVNARDAVNGVGRISIETSNVTLDDSYSRCNIYVDPGDYVMLTFSDTGMGISPELLEQVFEPFFTTKGEGKGTGLGLSTVYGIVKQNGGVIHLYSEVGIGTTFKIYLPRHDGPGELVTEDVEEVSLTGDETILVVEDEMQILNLTKAMLQQYGYKVLAARSPQQACQMASEHGDEIHLLLTDVVMPGMNGHDLKNRIEELMPGIKALFMSGYTADVIAHRGILAKGVNFIQKPFDMKMLAAKVRRVLDM